MCYLNTILLQMLLYCLLKEKCRRDVDVLLKGNNEGGCLAAVCLCMCVCVWVGDGSSIYSTPGGRSIRTCSHSSSVLDCKRYKGYIYS